MWMQNHALWLEYFFRLLSICVVFSIYAFADIHIIQFCIILSLEFSYLLPEHMGPCTLRITYSAHTDLSVKFQSHRSRYYNVFLSFIKWPICRAKI